MSDRVTTETIHNARLNDQMSLRYKQAGSRTLKIAKSRVRPKDRRCSTLHSAK